MKNKHSFLLLGLLILSVFLSFTACKKLNDATSIGSGLIPPVDNITTFDTTLSVEAFNMAFDDTDSIRSPYTAVQMLGKISADPLFGASDARMFFELKPIAYKTYPFVQHEIDSVALDSIVLVMDFAGAYGDTLVNQTVQVFEIEQDPLQVFKPDSTYLIRQEHFTYGSLPLSNPYTFKPASLRDSVKVFQDTTANQLRIKLHDSFGERLLRYDTAGANGAYASDSAFKTYFKGFALRAVSGSGGNSFVGVNLSGANTKLAVYYKYNKRDSANKDTAVTYFRFNTYTSASAQYIERTYGGEIASLLGNTTPANLVYIQNGPGTYANIKVPGLSGFNNAVIHRAELYMEQVYHETDSAFAKPNALYLDAYDPTIAAPLKPYRTIPYSFLIGSSGYPDYMSYGSYPGSKMDPVSGKLVAEWRFNLTRYVQNVVNGNIPHYDFRLFAPYALRTKYQPYPNNTDETIDFPALNPLLGAGRVRVGGGSNLNQPMKVRIIYSKL